MRAAYGALLIALLGIAPCSARQDKKPVTADDILAVADFGAMPFAEYTASLLSVSPDRTRIAFALGKANGSTNRYEIDLLIYDLRTGKSQIVDRGGEWLPHYYDRTEGGYTWLDFHEGIPEAVRPIWSHRGELIAFPKRTNGRTGLWIAAADGSGSHQVGHLDLHDVSLRFSSDDSEIIVQLRPQSDGIKRALEREKLTGYHLDGHVVPIFGYQPQISGSPAKTATAVNIATGTLSEVKKAEEDNPANDELIAESASGAIARRHLKFPGTVMSPGAISVSMGKRSYQPCDGSDCADDVTGLWWSLDGRTLSILRRGGPARSQSILYRWQAGQAYPRTVLATDDVVRSCEIVADSLYCLREGALQPARLVRIDPINGETEVLFDPNPQFSAFQLGSVQRLHWKNEFGLEAFGDLVLPPDHRAGEKHPLAIVQYSSRGFLRGGTGNIYPVQLLAAHGFAVLNYDDPLTYASRFHPKDWRDANRMNITDLAERRSLHSGLMNGIAAAEATGVIDVDRIGITGLSDGASTSIYALIHEKIFKAAAISQCCEDPAFGMAVLGPAFRDKFIYDGKYSPTLAVTPYIRGQSLTFNIDKVQTPILLQTSDREGWIALSGLAKFQDSGKPFDMFVFDDEYHLFWQPAHRLAAYRRSVAWFDFWLNGISSPSTGEPTDIARWSKWKSEGAAKAGS